MKTSACRLQIQNRRGRLQHQYDQCGFWILIMMNSRVHRDSAPRHVSEGGGLAGLQAAWPADGCHVTHRPGEIEETQVSSTAPSLGPKAPRESTNYINHASLDFGFGLLVSVVDKRLRAQRRSMHCGSTGLLGGKMVSHAGGTQVDLTSS